MACTQLFGDPRQNTIAPPPGRALGTTPTGMAPLLPGETGICTTGQIRCEGALLQTCSDDRSSWVTLQRCGAAALCQVDPAICLPATCSTDEMTCSGAVLQKCNADRTGWDVFNTCLSPAHCNANLRQCLTEACNPGDRRCDRSQTTQSPVLEACNDDRTGWSELDACVTRELCDQTLTSTGLGGLAVGSDGMVQVQPSSDPSTVVQCNLPACAVGETRCEGTRLQFCSEGRTGWITAEECASEALCQGSLGMLGTSGAPQCLAPVCASGQHRCSETGMLQVCSEDRSSFVDQEQCIGAPFCNAVQADQGQPGCRDAPCEAGQMQCNGAQIQVCREDRTALDDVGTPCESAALCNADDPANAFCEEPLCRRGVTSGDEFLCEGAQLQRCNESLVVYDTIQTCVTPALCDASQRQNGCRPPACQPGQFSCGDGFLQTCNADQTGFDNLENCGSQAQCDANAGRCADPCEPGATRCNATTGDLERCNDRLTGWQPIADCPSLALCDEQNGRCNICLPEQFSCADGQLRQCGDGRTFRRQNIPAECALDPNTGGGGIRACNQNNQVVVNPCPLGCTSGRCHECFQGQTQCVGNGQIRSCVNGFFGPPTSCSDGNACNGVEGCVNNQCVGGAPPNCNDNNQCTNDSCNPASGCVRTGFSSAAQCVNNGGQTQACANGQLQTTNCTANLGCTGGRCNNCNAGRCANGTQFQTCNNGQLSAAANCPNGQVCQGGGNCVFNCAALNCNDGNPCTNDTCNAQQGCVRSPAANGTSCADANACNGNETCQNGTCNNPADVVCQAPVCRTVSCNPQTGTCNQANVANGTPCNGGTCQTGTCVPTPPPPPSCTATCSGNTFLGCNGNNQAAGVVCLRQFGECRRGTCTATGCAVISNEISGTPCAGGTCNGAGACVATPPPAPACTPTCSGNNFLGCNGTTRLPGVVCLRQFGECVRGTCTANGCAFITNEIRGTACSAGFCDGTGSCVECTSSAQCPGTLTCNTAAGVCVDNNPR